MSATTEPAARRVGGHRERLLAAALICLREKGYAHTTARDLVAVSGTNLKSIGYHFGGKEELLQEALAGTFRDWTGRVESAVFEPGSFGSAAEVLERVLAVLVGSFEEVRPMLVACVESYPPALRSDRLREIMAASYADVRRAGAEMVGRACAELRMPPPGDPEAFVSVLVAISDGLMLQWLCDPGAAPSAGRVMGALGDLSALLAR